MTEDLQLKPETRDELKEYLYQYMPAIDERLRASNTSLIERPLSAGIIFVKELILEVSGDDNKEDFAEARALLT